MDRAAFFEAIRRGGELEAQLVYADWLLEQDEPYAVALGEAIVAGHQGNSALAAELEGGLRRALGSGVGSGLRFRQGLLEGAHFTFLKYRLLRPMLQWHSLLDLELRHMSAARVDLAKPWGELTYLRSLSVEFIDSAVEPQLAALARLPAHSTLEVLSLRACSYEQRVLTHGCVPALTNLLGPGLRCLGLSLPMSEQAVATFVKTPRFLGLSGLDVRSSRPRKRTLTILEQALEMSPGLTELVIDAPQEPEWAAFVTRHAPRVVLVPSWEGRYGIQRLPGARRPLP